jgi:uncharacterized protein YueI
MKRHFKIVSPINTAPISVVLSTDIPAQMELTFMNKNINFGSITPTCTAPPPKKNKPQLQKYVYLF